jgi:general secretion pathway protein L
MAITTKPNSFFATASQNAKSFWDWWLHELAAMVPKRVSMAFAGDASLIDVAIEDAALVLVKVGAGDNLPSQELKRVPVVSRDAAGMRTALDDLLRGEGRDVRVLVSPQHVLRKRVVLPMATEENLRDVVGFDMDRQTPFTVDQVYFGAAVVARDVARDRIEVEVVAVPKSAIELWLREMRAAGVSVHSIVAADEFSPALKRTPTPIELLPKSAGPARRWSNMQRINVGLLLIALLLTLAAVLLPIWQKREMVKELMPLSVKAESEFKITQRVTEEYTRIANEYNFVVGKKHANYPMVMLVDEITKISPDTMWIQNFEYKLLPKTRELQLAGEAVSVSKVIESLEQTPFLQNTSQRQASRQGSRPNIEYFTLASEVKTRPLPEALALDAATAPVLVQEAGPLVTIPPPIPPTSALTTMPAAPSRTPTATITPLANPPAVAPGSTAAAPPTGRVPTPSIQPQSLAVPPAQPQAVVPSQPQAVVPSQPQAVVPSQPQAAPPSSQPSSMPPQTNTVPAPSAVPTPPKAPPGPGNSPTPIPFPPLLPPITPLSTPSTSGQGPAPITKANTP